MNVQIASPNQVNSLDDLNLENEVVEESLDSELKPNESSSCDDLKSLAFLVAAIVISTSIPMILDFSGSTFVNLVYGVGSIFLLALYSDSSDSFLEQYLSVCKVNMCIAGAMHFLFGSSLVQTALAGAITPITTYSCSLVVDYLMGDS
jgi:hypothetical protein